MLTPKTFIMMAASHEVFEIYVSPSKFKRCCTIPNLIIASVKTAIKNRGEAASLEVESIKSM